MTFGLIAPLARWLEGRRSLGEARREAEIAKLKAEAKLAGFKARADIEWDMKWAHEDQRHTLRDEFLIALWALPSILLFIPATRPNVVEALAALKEFSPEAPTAYVAGWAVIFAAVFGVKQLVGLFLPAKYAALAKALGSLPPDIPQGAPSEPEDAPHPDKD